MYNPTFPPKKRVEMLWLHSLDIQQQKKSDIQPVHVFCDIMNTYSWFT
jgi:hypothetical protein